MVAMLKAAQLEALSDDELAALKAMVATRPITKARAVALVTAYQLEDVQDLIEELNPILLRTLAEAIPSLA